jgi:outer membrane protein assembly factor BamD
MHSRSSWVLATAIALCACAGGSKDGVDLTKPVTGEAARSAERSYKQGLEEKRVQNYLEATRYFEYVRNNFPYSQFAALSELAIADMNFERDDFAGAANAYKDFVKAHPSHPQADYAAWRVGLANFQDKPSDWFLLPPSFEKDQAPLKNALDALNRFVVTYPKSEYLNKAKDLIADCRRRPAAPFQDSRFQ